MINQETIFSPIMFSTNYSEHLFENVPPVESLELLKLWFDHSSTQQNLVTHKSIEFEQTRVLLSNVFSQKNSASRENFPAHITTSCLIFNEDFSEFIVLLHKKLNLWINPGGHADSDLCFLRSAAKELLEETQIVPSFVHSLKCYESVFIPTFIDVHEIPRHKNTPEHKHLDMVFIFSVEKTKCQVKYDPLESNGLEWVTVKNINLFEKNKMKVDQMTKKKVLKTISFLKN
jgi:8-oxo-dGTP pyrophosphatase MutT (NUDIX family)